jgi:negative regulator of genetic competence, sporulation and motility
MKIVVILIQIEDEALCDFHYDDIISRSFKLLQFFLDMMNKLGTIEDYGEIYIRGTDIEVNVTCF